MVGNPTRGLFYFALLAHQRPFRLCVNQESINRQNTVSRLFCLGTFLRCLALYLLHPADHSDYVSIKNQSKNFVVDALGSLYDDAVRTIWHLASRQIAGNYLRRG